MGVRAFLQKERYASRRNVAVLVLLLVVLPAAAAFGTAAFEHTIPQDTPVGIAPQDETVTADELDVISSGVALHATPESYDSTDDARRALSREEVYLVVEVPPGLFDAETNATATLVSDQRLAPFQDPSEYTASTMETELDRQLPATVRVEHDRVGDQYTLSEYLVPTGLLTILVLFAFMYLPFELRQERSVLERVAIESRIEAAVAAKIAHYGVLMIVPVSTFQLVSIYLGYRVTHFTVQTFAVLGITFVYLAAVSAVIMFLTGLRRLGLFINLAVMTGAFVFAGFIYPAGFFSALRLEITRSLPLHYSMIMTRSTMLKDTSLSLFADWLLALGLFTGGTLVALQLSIMYYRRTR